MNNILSTENIISWILGLTIVAIGILNLILVHPVPGIVFILLAVVFVPKVNNMFREKLGFKIPLAAKIILFVILIWFTLGISDLGEMID